MSEKKEKSLFKQLYFGNEDFFKKMKEPLVERSVKRKLKSGYDDILNQLDKAKEEQEKEIERLTECDFNRVVELELMITKDYPEQQEALKAIYKRLFDQDLKVDE